MIRTLILVDVGNLYFEDRYVNYSKLLRLLKKDREIYKAIAYVVEVGVEKEDKFFNLLKDIGFELRKKIGRGKFKANWDTGIVVECLRIADKVDEVTLVSGDGDYVPLLEELKRKEIKTRVAAFDRSVSYHLKTKADEFISLTRSL